MKTTVLSLTEVPEAIRGEYEPGKDGKFVLKIEGDVPGFVPAAELAALNTKLAEFRDNNRSLHNKVQEQDSKLKSFEGLDPAEFVQLKTKIVELEKKGVTKSEDVDIRVQKAVEAAVGPVQQTVAELRAAAEGEKKQRVEAEAALVRKNLETSLAQVGIKAGVDEKALDDFLYRGTKVWHIVDGQPVAKAGDVPLMSKRTGHPLQLEEWAQDLIVEAPHLFKQSKGGGATGSGAGAQPGPKKMIPASEFGQNIDAIAKGEVAVQMG